MFSVLKRRKICVVFDFYKDPLTIIILAFMLKDFTLLQDRQVTFYCTLAHRQHLRHLSATYCRRLFNEIQYFQLTFSKFYLRHISDICRVGESNLLIGFSHCQLSQKATFFPLNDPFVLKIKLEIHFPLNNWL